MYESRNKLKKSADIGVSTDLAEKQPIRDQKNRYLLNKTKI